jgi:lysophospholipase L1-like esterase
MPEMDKARRRTARSGIAKALLLVAGILAGLALGEGMLRLLSPQIFPIHPPGMYEVDSDVGYVLTPGFKGSVRRAEFDSPVTIGEAGLRGADPRHRRPDTFRILVLGDSLAWGFGVEDDETFAARLEALLSRRYPDLDIQVLNGAVPGYGTADELAYLRSRGVELGPDLVVVQFLSVNDLLENKMPASEWATVRDGMLAAVQTREMEREALTLLPLWERIRVSLKQHSHLARLVSDVVGYLGTRAGLLGGIDARWGEDFSAEDARRGRDLLVELASTARERGAAVLFLYTTSQAQVVAESYHPPRSAAVVEAAAVEAGVPWLDASAALQSRDDRLELYYPKDGHWTAQGHTAIAEILASRIVELDMVAVAAD